MQLAYVKTKTKRKANSGKRKAPVLYRVMTLLHATLLGLLQGLTEFLPISSSGHLVLAQNSLDLRLDPESLLGFDVVLHAGTLLALLICYFGTWKRLGMCIMNDDQHSRRQLLAIIVATIPAVIAGVFFKDILTENFRSVESVAGALAVTGVVLCVGEWIARRRPARVPDKIGTGQDGPSLQNASAFIIGIAQALALIPGISRSGITIATGQVTGLSRRDALDFSFLMAVPAIGGALVLTVFEVANGEVTLPSSSVLLLGFVVSCIVSVLAIRFLRSFVSKRSLAWFAPYLFVLSMFLLFA